MKDNKMVQNILIFIVGLIIGLLLRSFFNISNKQ